MSVPRKKTIRRMPPKTREVAHMLRELHSVVARLENRLLPMLSELEFDSRALANARAAVAPQKPVSKTEPLLPDEAAQVVGVPESKPHRRRSRKSADTSTETPLFAQPELEPDTEPAPASS